jgi:hypothetical protein
MVNLITKTRSLIYDPAGGSQVFTDADIQDMLDSYRIDVRYELLTPGPSIVNAASTANIASYVWADYYSTYKWWEDDVVIQGNNTTTGAAFFGHWAFELNIFTAGVAPGQYPPIFATGKSFDVYAASAALLDMWAAQYAGAYDFTTDEQQFRRSQIIDGKLKLGEIYRRKARTTTVLTRRADMRPDSGAHAEHVDLGWVNDKMAGDH